MSGIGRAVVAWMVGAAATALAEEPPREPASALGEADRIEAVQARAWQKRGRLALAPLGAYALNDPFLLRGGAGLRATYWPRALFGVSLEVGAFGQEPSEAARVAQRELRARMRATGAGWLALAGAEIAAADGKLAFGTRLVPFELVLRVGAGASSSTEDLRGHPVAALGAAVGLRWFVSPAVGLETALSWRTASLRREVDGKPVSSRDSVVALELAVPLAFGGAR